MGVGVGAIVGGGILVLAGAAFAATGPSAIVAFALNGVIALLTALSFAEVSSKFPQSGGTYVFAKRVLSVESAFTVGWVVWFASIVAAVLYALGFGQFAAIAISDILRMTCGSSPPWLLQRPMICALAVAATTLYALSLLRTSRGGSQWMNIGKVVVFAVLIACGLCALPGKPPADLGRSLQPFFAKGAAGLFQAMGFSFIAFQGFDLIAAVAGEVRQPERTIPRAMLISLGIALLIYLPLLFVISTVGMQPGQSVTEAARENAETIVAVAARNYLGVFGYWLVMVAAVLSMLSALHANLFAASRVAAAMARDRTLPRRLGVIGARFKVPVRAIAVTAAIVVVILLLLPDVAAAGAASSLIFLVTFALAHWIAVLVRQRSAERPPPFCTPLFPAVPVVGGLACLALAVYQGIAVPSAGRIAMIWLLAGGLLFLVLFARRARVVDASKAGADPELVRLRGRSPLVLVPIANPDNARGLVAVATALAPSQVGRVMLLTVVPASRNWRPDEDPLPLRNAQAVLGEAIAASVHAGMFPEALTTVAEQTWLEISRVAAVHHCESLLLGLSKLTEQSAVIPLEQLINSVDCDVVVLRAPKTWELSQVNRILVPTGGGGIHERLLARLLASFARSSHREITFLRVLPQQSPESARRQAQRGLRRIANDLGLSHADIQVVCSDEPLDTVAAAAGEHDLTVLGIQRLARRQKLFGQFALHVARKTSCPLLLISHRG